MRLEGKVALISGAARGMGCDRDTTVGIDNILAEYQALPEVHRHLQIYYSFGHSPNVEVPRRVGLALDRFSAMAWDLHLKAEAGR